MAEYVDRLKLLPKVKTEYIEAADLGYGYYDYLLQKDLMDIEPADVVERTEYERVLKENERLRGDLEFKSEALNSIGQIHKEYVSKIDKAVEEMNGYARFHRDKIHNDVERGKYLAYEKSLEILKRNIGE